MRELVLAYLVPKRAQQLGALLHRGNCLRRGLHARDRGLHRVRNAQLPRLGRSRLRKLDRAFSYQVVEQRDVQHAAADRAEHGAPVPVVVQRRERDAAALQLQPEKATERGRDPD